LPDQQARDDAPIATSKTTSSERELVAQSVTINRPASYLFAFWRKTPNLASIMENIISIEELESNRSRWKVRAPLGKTVEWVSQVTHEVPGEEITLQAEEEADVAHSGRIQFTEAPGRGTIVTATIAYEPPAGTVGRVVAKILQREPNIQARRDLRRFKQLMETGEIATNARNRRMLEEEMA